ncbi:MAG: glycosyltransferase [Pseudomonadota bacterium]
MNLLAIVYDSPAHLDFGGNGYRRGLESYVDGGHQVDLILSDKPSTTNSIDVAKLPFRHINHDKSLQLAGNFSFGQEIAESIQWLSAYLREHPYDLIFVDRICGFSQVALRLCCIDDYIVVGSGGVSWGHRYNLGYGKEVLQPLRQKNARLVAACAHFDLSASDICHSYWSVSKRPGAYFLPSIWFHSQALGPDSAGASSPLSSRSALSSPSSSSRPSPPTSECPARLLVTYGNSMPLWLVKPIVNEIKLLRSRAPEIHIKVLAGTEQSLQFNLNELNGLGIEIVRWADYGEEFSKADFVISHGGVAHIYNCIRYRAIPICFPSLADQFFNAKRVCELRIGYSFFRYTRARRLFGLFNRSKHFRRGCVADTVCGNVSMADRLRLLDQLNSMMNEEGDQLVRD